MLEIKHHTFKEEKNEFGLIKGKRYEFQLDVTVPEDDPLHAIKALMLCVLFDVEEKEGPHIYRYWFFDGVTGSTYNDALKEEEEEIIVSYCKQQLGLS